MPTIPTTEKRPFIPAVGVIQLEAIYTCFGQITENVYHDLVGGGAAAPTVAQMTAAANAVISWEAATCRGSRHASAAMTLVRARDLSVQGGPVIEVAPTGTMTGAAAGAGFPNNVTAAIKHATGLGGRSQRGRSYWIGLPQSYSDGTNQLTAAGAAALRTCMLALRDAINALSGNQLVVLSYAHNKFWRDAAQATPITNFTVDLTLDSQRRRLPGRGK